MEQLKTKISLTDEQMAKIKSGHEASRQQVQQLKENTQMSAVEKKEQLVALRKQNRENFLSMLTPEQKTRFEELKKNHHRKSVK
jgi:Spy/CpxP family protein refolding chaperone